MENLQEQEVVVEEVDTYGGWLMAHHTLTRTWDTRTPLTALASKKQAKIEELAKVQAELDVISQQETQYAKEIEDAKNITIETPVDTATSTPEH